MTFDPAILEYPTTQATEVAWQPARLGLVRLAGKPYAELLHLKFSRTVAVFDKLLAIKAQLAAQVDQLNNDLYAEIAHHDGALKSGLVALKRRVFNEKLPRRSDVQLLRQYGLTQLALQTAQLWIAHKAHQRLLAEAQATFDTELIEKRRLLQDFCQADTFQKAVQSASPALYAALQRYIKADPQKFRRRERKTEQGAFQYLVRMTSKTSPFGHFGPVAPAVFDVHAQQALVQSSAVPARQAVSELRRVVVALILVSLSKAPGVQEYLAPQLNQTYTFDGSEIVFQKLRTQVANTSDAMIKVQRRGKRFPLLDTAVALLEQQAFVSLSALADACAASLPSLERATIDKTLEKLVGGGLINLTFPLASYEQQPLQSLAAFLATCPSPEAHIYRAEVLELDRIQAVFATTEPSLRARLHAQAREIIEHLLRWRPLAESDYTLLDQLFIEDVSYPDLRFQLGAPVLQQIMPDVAALLECGFQRDGMGLARSWLLDAFVDRYGSHGSCDNLAEFAQAYQQIFSEFNQLALNTNHQHPRMSQSNAIQARNRRYAAFMDAALKRDPYEVVLQPKELLDFAQALGSSDERTSVGLHLQLVAEDQAALERGDVYAVLNYTLPGFGRFMARYQHCFDAAGREDLNQHVSQQWSVAVGQQSLPVSLVSVLDHNAQAYAPQTEWQLVPADEQSSADHVHQLHTRDLQIHHDAQRNQLVLSSQRTHPHQSLALLYLGSLHLTSLPFDHRVLAQLSPTVYHMEALRPREHAHLKPPQTLDQIKRSPRLRVGRLIVQRATWDVPAAELPPLDAADDWELFFNAYAWSKQHDLPSATFARFHRDYTASFDMWTAHKPSQIDWENFFSVQMLKQLLDEHVISVAFEEMLPTPYQQVAQINGETVISELQIEWTRGGAA